jgi:hypothetical protein
MLAAVTSLLAGSWLERVPCDRLPVGPIPMDSRPDTPPRAL